MKSLVLLSLILTHSWVWASNITKDLDDLKAQQKASLEAFKAASPDWQKIPNVKYEEFYTKWLNEGLKAELDIHDKHCQTSPAHCLTPTQRQGREAQTRVAIRLVQVQNAYGKRTDIDDPTKEAWVNRIKRTDLVNLCLEHGQECDKLSALDLEFVEAKKKRNEKIELMKENFAKTKGEDWETKLDDPAVKDFLIEIEKEKLSLNLEMLKELCAKSENQDGMFCLDGASLLSMNKLSEQKSCMPQRLHQLHKLKPENLVEKEKALLASHEKDWDSAKSANKCAELLSIDKIAFTPIVVPGQTDRVVAGEGVDEEVEEKDPKNYVPESCEWVNDLPRRIHFGPGCGNIASRICVGYVICKQKTSDAKFVRASTCGAEHCGSTKQDAVNCTKQQTHFSRKASNSRESVSSPLKKMLSGGTPQ